MLEIRSISVGKLFTNVYLVFDSESREGILIDPGDEAERIMELVNRLGVDVEAIYLTHGHFDHLLAVRDLKADLNCKLYLHPADREILPLVPHDARYFLGRDVPPPPKPDEWLIDGQSIKVGRYYGKVIHTPGHTPGGICLYNPPDLFTGDTLFVGAVGRTDFPGGDMNQFMRSIRERLLVLPEETVVWPGHGYGGSRSTIGEEKRSNPFL